MVSVVRAEDNRTMTVPARVSLVTLGVADVATSTAFYQALGWPLSSSSVPGVVSFFKTAGAVLALYGSEDLRADADLPPGAATSGSRDVALAINCASAEEVDDAIAAVSIAGGNVLKQPSATEWGGYSGYVTDLDGHAIEIAYNPGWPLDDAGLPVLP